MNSKLAALKGRAIDALAAARSNTLLRGTLLMGAAEAGNRVSRVLTGIALARSLGTAEFGAMALILTAYELVRIFIHNGLGARVMQARDEELDEVCHGVDRLNWAVGGLMFVIQIALAWPIQYFFGANIGWLLVALSVVPLIYPLCITRACVAQREERLGFLAGMQFFQITGDNLCTAAMALAGFGLWSAVIPKIVVAVAYAAITRAKVAPRKPTSVSPDMRRGLFDFCRMVIASESLNTIRANADNLIVGKVLGLEAFGIYVFAFNNGSGIASGLASALGQSVQPYLSKGKSAGDMLARFQTSVISMSLVIMPLIVLQVALAPWYVPLIYGAKWTPAIPSVMLMCLGALSRPLIVATSMLLRATGAVGLEWRMSQINALLFIVAIVGGLPFGVEGVAACVAVVNFLPAIVFARIAISTIPGALDGAPAAEFARVGA